MTKLAVQDALRLAAGLTEWLCTPDAARVHVDFWERLRPAGHSAMEVCTDINARLSARLKASTPIWCDMGMTDMLAASTAALPDQAVQTDPLIPSTGILVFAKPLPLEWAPTDQVPEGITDTQPQVITWDLINGGVHYFAQSWCVARPAVVNVPNRGKARIRDLWPRGARELWEKGGPPEQINASQAILRLLNAFAGISRSPLVVDEESRIRMRKVRSAAQSTKVPDLRVRRLYLRHPEVGAAELNALRLERAGAPRGHWVRGHWKNQWHSSVEEHRPTWIDGYARGDFGKGQVSGDAILVGNTSPAEVAELSDAHSPSTHTK